MSDKEFLSELRRGKEEEFFRKKDYELIERMRKDARRDEQTVEPAQESPAQESKVPEAVKPEESESRTPPASRNPSWIMAIIAIGGLIGLVWVWMTANVSQ
jgi:hypothetical protein